MRALLIALVFTFLPAPALAQDARSAELIARAEAGDLEAAESLGALYAGESDFTAGIRWSRRAAEGGRPEAMANLAVYLRLEGRVRDADRWERRALAAGSDGARFNIASRTLATPGASANEWSRAIALLTDAQHPQTPSVIDQLSMRYDEEPFATPERRRQLTSIAADQGAPAAQWRLAMMLRAGFGGERNIEEAYAWVSRSADSGELAGIVSKAVMLASGEGVTRDLAAAAIWYQRAVDEHKSAHALRSLGAMYLSGELPADYPRGFAYLMIAHDAGDPLAQRIAQIFASQATPEILTTAAAIRDAWLSEHGPAQ